MEAVTTDPMLSDIAETSEEKSVIYLLPSNASHTIVQLEPSLKISCVLPPAERDIVVDDNGNYKPSGSPYSCKLKTPTLVLTQILLWYKRKCDPSLAEHKMCKCFSCNITAALKRGHRSYKSDSHPYFYHWNTVDLEKCSEEVFHAAPYAVANTDGTYICWGRNEYPPSLRIANTIYWMSHLNNSPGKFSYTRAAVALESNKALAEKMSLYSEQFLEGDKPELASTKLLSKNRPKWSNKREEIFGKKFIATSEKTGAVFLSYDKTLIENHPESVVKNSFGVPAIVGFANRDSANGIWIIDTISGPLRLREDQVFVR